MGQLGLRFSARQYCVIVAVALGALGHWPTTETAWTANEDFPCDVELIEPITSAVVPQNPTSTRHFNTDFFFSSHSYPSYVKGKDPVEEYNRHRLHVDTSYFAVNKQPIPDEVNRDELQENLNNIRRKFSKTKSQEKNNVYGNKVMRNTNREMKEPIKRVGCFDPSDAAGQESKSYPRRYEESDPHVFAYERMEPGEETEQRRQNSLPGDSMYFQYFNFYGDGSYNAGSKRGNVQHYIEQHERGSPGAGVFQKRVKWADKKGGFGEHYWDLNHVTK
ncbi:uncharacterized protein LOC129723801 [Wyeomyia smithii]|uniref:uncharacterized protein LOC129723801 n=1 Tax=Wyeomyia smithii TaxID=174621 RepID=UPI00246810C8|nr:uncharacterized protein LOC129723801 [Wyeomyia smithii]